MLKILLVEDNKGDAELIGELIRETGVPNELTWFNSGQRAMDFFEAGGEMDFVIMDLNLPKTNGLDVLSLLKQKGTLMRMPVIIMSGSSYQGDIEQSEANGAYCYLLKPMSNEEMGQMTAVLRNLFEGRLDNNMDDHTVHLFKSKNDS